MKKPWLLLLFLVSSLTASAQEVHIDGRLQPLLNEFLDICKSYGIDYHDQLFKLEKIDIVNTLTVSEEASTLGMLRRDSADDVIAIEISWMAQLDAEILKIVAFHEFAHYFLQYSTHICDDCGKIMSVVNSSYFDITRDWDNQVKLLFEESPILKKKNAAAGLTYQLNKP